MNATCSAASWRLSVDGLVSEQLALSLDELRERFAERTVVATLQCASVCELSGNSDRWVRA